MRLNNSLVTKKSAAFYGVPLDVTPAVVRVAGSLRAWCRRSWCRFRCSWTTCWGSPSRCLLSEGGRTNTHKHSETNQQAECCWLPCVRILAGVFTSGYLSWLETGRIWTFRWAGRGWRRRSRPPWTCWGFAQTCGETRTKHMTIASSARNTAAVILLWRSSSFFLTTGRRLSASPAAACRHFSPPAPGRRPSRSRPSPCIYQHTATQTNTNEMLHIYTTINWPPG